MSIQTVNANGVTFHYWEGGGGTPSGGGTPNNGGTPVVLLHGFPLSHEMWSSQLVSLASAGVRAIAPDLRGFGRSASDAPFTIDSLADDVRAVLAGIGALPCVLGGLSMGGYVALAFARKYPADLGGLMLVDTRADADSATAQVARDRNIDLVREKGAPAIADAMIPKLLAPGAAEGRPELARDLRRMIEACPAGTIERALVALRDRPDATPVLPTIRVPTLIVVGDGDQITPVELAEGMRDAIPGSSLVVIRGAGHMSPIEQPAQVSREINGFVSRFGSGR